MVRRLSQFLIKSQRQVCYANMTTRSTTDDLFRQVVVWCSKTPRDMQNSPNKMDESCLSRTTDHLSMKFQAPKCSMWLIFSELSDRWFWILWMQSRLIWNMWTCVTAWVHIRSPAPSAATTTTTIWFLLLLVHPNPHLTMASNTIQHGSPLHNSTPCQNIN